MLTVAPQRLFSYSIIGALLTLLPQTIPFTLHPLFHQFLCFHIHPSLYHNTAKCTMPGKRSADSNLGASPPKRARTNAVPAHAGNTLLANRSKNRNTVKELQRRERHEGDRREQELSRRRRNMAWVREKAKLITTAEYQVKTETAAIEWLAIMREQFMVSEGEARASNRTRR